MKEKIEEYLEVYNASLGIAGAGENVSSSSTALRRHIQATSLHAKALDEEDWEKKNKSHRRKVHRLTKAEREDETAIEELKELGVNVGDDSDEESDAYDGQSDSSDVDMDDEEDLAKRKKSKKVFYGKKRKYVEPEVIADPRDIPSITKGKLLEPLTKRKRQPAQEKVYKELTEINERIASLIQVRQMGLSTAENKKQLKQLMKDRKVKAFALRSLQCRVRASNKYRVKQRKIVRSFTCARCSSIRRSLVGRAAVRNETRIASSTEKTLSSWWWATTYRRVVSRSVADHRRNRQSGWCQR